jgi:hypothetical protein
MPPPLQSDPRWIEHRDARQATRAGLDAPRGSYDRYRAAIPGYLELIAEHTEPHTRLPVMKGLVEDDNLPLGAILIAFKATHDEAAQLADRPVLHAEPYSETEHLRSLPYSAYLRSPHWTAVRREALNRAGNRCQICNRAELLQVHHRTYERVGAERPADVIVLCDVCHSNHHNKPRRSAA